MLTDLLESSKVFGLCPIGILASVHTYFKKILSRDLFRLQQQNLGRRFGTSKMHLSPRWPRLLSVLRQWLLIVTPVVGFCNCSMFCCMLLYVPSSFAIILMGKRELVALLILSSWCLVIVVWLFLAVPWVCLQFVIVVFPDHTHFFLPRE